WKRYAVRRTCRVALWDQACMPPRRTSSGSRVCGSVSAPRLLRRMRTIRRSPRGTRGSPRSTPGPGPPTAESDRRLLPGALTRYRVIAWIVGVLLIVLFCVGIPLKAAAGNDSVNAVAGLAHGVIFYPLYLILTLDLARRVKMP